MVPALICRFYDCGITGQLAAASFLRVYGLAWLYYRKSHTSRPLP